MPLILHLTDMHLHADAAGRLKGIPTLASFRAVKSLAWRRHPAPDALILGGDLAQDELGPTYRLLADDITGWCEAVRVTPGNHCNLPVLERTLLPALDMPPMRASELRLENWLVIPLNSHDPDASPGGRLGEDELARLERLLAETDADHALIALHHHPAPIGSPWMDAMMLEDADDFWRAIEASGKARAVLFGHVHQELDTMRGDVRLLGTPSTCVQFKPQTETFALDVASPGYRWLHLSPDGGIETGVERVEGFLPPDPDDTSFY